QLRLRIARDIGDLIGRETIVDGKKDTAEIARRNGNLEEGRAVFHKDSHDIALADPLPLQKPREMLDALPKLAVADPPVLIDNRYFVGPARRVIFQETAEIDHSLSLPFLVRRHLVGTRHPEIMHGNEVEDHLLRDRRKAEEPRIAPEPLKMRFGRIAH